MNLISFKASIPLSVTKRRRTASVTPPVTPKITPAPDDNPNGISIASHGICARSIPASFIIRIISVVVNTKSTSCSPSVLCSGRRISAFFAVHGIIETTIVFLLSFLLFRASSFNTAPNICCGERQVEIFSRNSGYFCSQNFTHAGQQDVNNGNFSSDFTLSKNSFDSSIIVRSAPKSVSYISSNPILRSAATSFPREFSPFGIPNLSPTATRTAGAICTTTLVFLSASASHTG